MEKITGKKTVVKFMCFCGLIYFTSYISRINLGAVLVEMTNTGFSSKELISSALTASFITYGIGQLISGWMGDKFIPQNLISWGFIITAAVNIIVGFLKSPAWIIPLWAVNGFAHSLMWPPMVKLMTAFLYDKDYRENCAIVSYGASVATLAVYLFSPIIITLSNFRFVFLTSGVCAISMAIMVKYIFSTKYKFVENGVRIKTEKRENGNFSAAMLVLLIAAMFIIIFQGSLRDGVQTWMPSYISDTFNLGSAISILSGVILPIFSLLCNMFASWLNKNVFKNEFVGMGTIFGIGLLSALILAMFPNNNAILSVLLSAILEGAMNGVNFIATCMLPAYFAKTGKISFVSGLLNSCTYVGSAISIYGIAVFSNKFGWNMTIWLWAAIAFLGTSISIVFAKKWAHNK